MLDNIRIQEGALFCFLSALDFTALLKGEVLLLSTPELLSLPLLEGLLLIHTLPCIPLATLDEIKE